jgi:hypothetical protein
MSVSGCKHRQRGVSALFAFNSETTVLTRRAPKIIPEVPPIDVVGSNLVTYK